MVSRRRAQLGAFLMARWVLLMLILVAMLVVPIWLKRSGDDKQQERVKAEVKAESDMNATYTAAPAAAAGPRPIGFGLTFAVGSPAEPLTDVSYLSCQGQPQPTDRPEKDACNPYQGDTSCRVVLPVLCVNPSSIVNPAPPNANPLANWTAGTLGATAPVMGALLESRPVADARCEKELGQGWRMADFHAGGTGWSLSGRPGPGLSPSGSTRYWVAINDQAANCWDSKP